MSNNHFIWPLSKSATPDEMNTSYGPRIDSDEWDFHDGIDLPAAVGTSVHAMADGVVHRAGPADKIKPGQGFGSTHVVLQVVDPSDGLDDLFLVYIHLDSIAAGIIQGAQVNRGDAIGAVGQEDAQYPHLHFEFRKGGPEEENSVHPLSYLPYFSTFNFTPGGLDRHNFYGQKRAVRICFEAPHRHEGDLRGVDVELTGIGASPKTRHVDFNDRTTIKSDKGDEEAFLNDIAVEGYQKSNLKGEGLDDLHYGVIVSDIAQEYESIELRVLDVNNEDVESGPFDLPTLEVGEHPVNISENFEGQTFPPTGWELKLLPGNVCRIDSTEAFASRHLLCRDQSGLPGTLIRSGLRFALPANRMSWRLAAEIRPTRLVMERGEVIYPLALLSDDTLVAAAQLRKISNTKFVAGVLIRSSNNQFRERIAVNKEILRNETVKWELDLLRLGTRQTTAVLRLGDHAVARINGETRDVEPNNACLGILHQSSNLEITLRIDQVRLTERPRL